MARQTASSTKADEPTTTTTDDTTVPSEVAPGDAPADTLDPSERVSSTPVAPGEQAKLEGTVNAVTLLPNPPQATEEQGEQRVEEYEATAPDGSKVTVRHNLDTGETTRA